MTNDPKDPRDEKTEVTAKGDLLKPADERPEQGTQIVQKQRTSFLDSETVIRPARQNVALHRETTSPGLHAVNTHAVPQATSEEKTQFRPAPEIQSRTVDPKALLAKCIDVFVAARRFYFRNQKWFAACVFVLVAFMLLFSTQPPAEDQSSTATKDESEAQPTSGQPDFTQSQTAKTKDQFLADMLRAMAQTKSKTE